MFVQQFTFYVLTFILPFVAHIFVSVQTGFYLLLVCTGSLFLFLIYELIQMAHEGFKEYIDGYNSIDLLILPVLIAYIYIHQNNTFATVDKIRKKTKLICHIENLFCQSKKRYNDRVKCCFG